MQETELRTGDVILYKLRPRDRPIDPDKLWQGEVLTTRPIEVSSLEPGYEGLRELVHPEQIVKIERP